VRNCTKQGDSYSDSDLSMVMAEESRVTCHHGMDASLHLVLFLEEFLDKGNKNPSAQLKANAHTHTAVVVSLSLVNISHPLLGNRKLGIIYRAKQKQHRVTTYNTLIQKQTALSFETNGITYPIQLPP